MSTKSKSTNREKILKMIQFTFLLALVIVLQVVGTFIKIGPLPISLVLIPIVVGSFILGIKEGALLGFAFGVVTAVMGINGTDPFSHYLFQQNAVAFIGICLIKATAAGLVAGLIYKALNGAFKNRFKTLSTVVASVTAPVVNTGIFVLGMLLFYFTDMSPDNAFFAGGFDGMSGPVEVVFLGLAGFNFVGEFLVNLIISPALVRIIDTVKKKYSR